MGSAAVLVIDDDSSITRAFTRILQKKGYEADTAHTGKEALQKAAAKHYALALVDVCLPDINGLHLLEKLSMLDSRMIKIVITGSNAETSKTAADAYLLKPVKPQELLALIEQKLQHPRNQRFLF